MLLAGIVAGAQPQVVVAQEGGGLFTGARGLQRRPGARATRLRQLDDSLHDSWVTAYLGLEDARAVGGGAGLPQLLAPRLITDRRPYGHLQQIYR